MPAISFSFMLVSFVVWLPSWIGVRPLPESVPGIGYVAGTLAAIAALLILLRRRGAVSTIVLATVAWAVAIEEVRGAFIVLIAVLYAYQSRKAGAPPVLSRKHVAKWLAVAVVIMAALEAMYLHYLDISPSLAAAGQAFALEAAVITVVAALVLPRLGGVHSSQVVGDALPPA